MHWLLIYLFILKIHIWSHVQITLSRIKVMCTCSWLKRIACRTYYLRTAGNFTHFFLWNRSSLLFYSHFLVSKRKFPNSLVLARKNQLMTVAILTQAKVHGRIFFFSGVQEWDMKLGKECCCSVPGCEMKDYNSKELPGQRQSTKLWLDCSIYEQIRGSWWGDYPAQIYPVVFKTWSSKVLKCSK